MSLYEHLSNDMLTILLKNGLLQLFSYSFFPEVSHINVPIVATFSFIRMKKVVQKDNPYIEVFNCCNNLKQQASYYAMRYIQVYI